MATYYIDAAVGSDANAGTSPGSGNAWATITKAAGLVAAGDKVWIKASASYFEAPALSTTGGTPASCITWEGYASAPGDGGPATIDAQATRATCLTIAKNYQVFRNLTLTGAATRCVDMTAGLTGVRLEACRLLKGAGAAGAGLDSSNYSVPSPTLVGCLISGFAGYANARAGGWMVGCEVVNCGPLAVPNYGQPFVVEACLLRGGAGPAVDFGSNVSNSAVRNCTIVGKTGAAGSGVRFPASSTFSEVMVLNNIFGSNAAYGIDSPAYPAVLANFNAFYGNTSGPRSSIAAGANDVTLTADPFAGSAGGNYALNSAAGGGALLRAAGYPGAFPGGTTTAYPDLGAAQHQDSGGGGTTTVAASKSGQRRRGR